MKLKPWMAALALSLSGLAAHAAILGQASSDTSFSSTADSNASAQRTSAPALLESESSAEMAESASAFGGGKAFEDSAKEADGKILAESEGYAIVLAGLGVVGFLARRRRND